MCANQWIEKIGRLLNTWITIFQTTQRILPSLPKGILRVFLALLTRKVLTYTPTFQRNALHAMKDKPLLTLGKLKKVLKHSLKLITGVRFLQETVHATGLTPFAFIEVAEGSDGNDRQYLTHIS
jgi:hypothetical protein